MGRDYIGASDAGAILGVDKFRNADDVMESLNGKSIEINAPMLAGSWLGPIIASQNSGHSTELPTKYDGQHQEKWATFDPEFMEPMVVHPDRPWLRVHLDYLAGEVLAEIKTTKYRPKIPYPQWVAQCQCIMAVLCAASGGEAPQEISLVVVDGPLVAVARIAAEAYLPLEPGLLPSGQPEAPGWLWSAAEATLSKDVIRKGSMTLYYNERFIETKLYPALDKFWAEYTNKEKE